MLVLTLKEAKEQLCTDTKFQRFLGAIRNQETLQSSQQLEQNQYGIESAADQPKQLLQKAKPNHTNSLIYSIKINKKQHEIIQSPQPFSLQQPDHFGNNQSQKKLQKLEQNPHSEQSFCLSQSSQNKSLLPKIVSPLIVHKMPPQEARQQTAVKIRPKHEKPRNISSIEVHRTQTQAKIFQDEKYNRENILDWQSSRRYYFLQKKTEESNINATTYKNTATNAQNQSKKQLTSSSSNPFSIHIKQTANQMKATSRKSSQQSQNISNISTISQKRRESSNNQKSRQESMTSFKNQNESNSSYQMISSTLENSLDNLKRDRKVVQFKKGSFQQSTSVSQESSVEAERAHIHNQTQHQNQLSLPRYYKQSANSQSQQLNNRGITPLLLDKKEIQNIISKIISLVQKLKSSSQQLFCIKDACSQEQNSILASIDSILDNSKEQNISHNTSSISNIQNTSNDNYKKEIQRRQQEIEDDIQYQVLKSCKNVQVLRHLKDILETEISAAAKTNNSCSFNSTSVPALRKQPQFQDSGRNNRNIKNNQRHYPQARSNNNNTRSTEPPDWIAGVGSQDMELKKGIIWDVVGLSQTNKPFYQTFTNERH